VWGIAARNAEGTPSQANYQSGAQNVSQQPAVHQAYPATYQSPDAACTAHGGYDLPQPSSTGNVDLSGVKPVTVGQGIAEAIAKARSIAAQKGITNEPRTCE
jgi:far upstream element-binding protein